MEKFPEYLKPSCIHKYNQIKYKFELSKWRNIIHDCIINNKIVDLLDENNKPVDKHIIQDLRIELHELGWLTELAYNGSYLYIYDKNNMEMINKLKSLKELNNFILEE